MGIVKGGDLMLFVGGKSIGFATSHTLNINADAKEFSTKDSGGKWQNSDYGILNWTASSENLLSNDQEGVGYNELVEYMINRTEIQGIFALEGDSGETKRDLVPTNGWNPKNSDGYFGTMIITSIEINAPNGENASFTVQFTGTGALYDNRWYLVNQDLEEVTHIDKNTEVEVNDHNLYYFMYRGEFYNTPGLTKIPISGVSTLVKSYDMKPFSDEDTATLNIEIRNGNFTLISTTGIEHGGGMQPQ